MQQNYIKKIFSKRGKVVFIFVLFLVISIVVYGLWFVYQLFGVKGNTTEFTIEGGWGVNEISMRLHEEGVVNSKFVFETYLYLRELEGQIKAGTYKIPSVNLMTLAEFLTKGTPFTGVRVTLIEGWTLEQMAGELDKHGFDTAENFLKLVNKPKTNGFTEEIFPILYAKPDTVDLEGYLFPDTYFFPADATSEQIISTMLTNLTLKLNEQIIRDTDARDLTFHDVLTMASIIEKEVRTPEDKRLVSGLLWKRIDEGIPLQVDSTVNYVTGGSKPAVSINETKIDSKFNTYLYKGLPPGPISNPGFSSIMAAIYPEDSPYYFYLSKPSGETVFSVTGVEHNAAKQKYLK